MVGNGEIENDSEDKHESGVTSGKEIDNDDEHDENDFRTLTQAQFVEAGRFAYRV